MSTCTTLEKVKPMSSDVVSSTQLVVAKPERQVLPPCCVCGERASGFHYGANTCEACKTFFRRSLVRTVEYRCRSNNSCILIPGRRHCSACRLERCHKIGMSKTAIKNGRYTSEKRNHVIEEVRRLKMQSLMREDGTSLKMSMDRMKKLDTVVEVLTECFLNKSDACRTEFAKTAQTEELKYLEHKSLEKKIFGSMKRLPREEYTQVYQMTGIDIDGRRSLLARYVRSCEMILKYFIEYCKEIPGFRKMCYEDQKSLMKGSCADTWIIQFSHLYNVEDGTCVFPFSQGLVYSQEEVICLYKSREEQQIVWDMFKRVQMLDLTNEERAIAGALSVMNCDAVLTEEGQKIRESSTDYLMDTLVQLLEKNHEPEEKILCRLISTMTEIRTVSQLCFGVHIRIVQNVQDWSLPKLNLYHAFFNKGQQKEIEDTNMDEAPSQQEVTNPQEVVSSQELPSDHHIPYKQEIMNDQEMPSSSNIT